MIRALYEIVRDFVRANGTPGINNNGLKRFFFRLGPLTLAATEYEQGKPERPYSGDPLAVLESVWLYGKRFARGYGITRPWGSLFNIEVEINGSRYGTADGILNMRPPAALNSNTIRFHNTSQTTPADIAYTIHLNRIHVTEWHQMIADQFGSDHFEWTHCGGFITNLAPRASQTVEIFRNMNERAQPIVDTVAYKTEPGILEEDRVTRLWGRPEWEAQR